VKTKLTRFELQLMEQFWKLGAASVREVQESLPAADRPAYTTVQTIVYRLVDKGVVRRTKKIGNAHIFEAVVTRKSAYRRLLDDVLGLFGGSAAAVMAHLVDSGKLTLRDLKEAEQMLARKGGKS
jgi:BlaI family transcriptional regulator, penicillinase repressor